ncbi:GTP-binding protein Era [Breznakia sp. PF5-3]|uniref:GTPase Era n=1 Tax=unclassified Breznakia TaxID=2623764 RepID=UPI0024069374|nr:MULTISPECIES: GTPase Era [unclassified Breznakia]MDF9824429.1 GTP-binding protein Era [Breznakia sp. PM6-1]MDF9835158.1 GTP-binding protein Era [Breznakia sp. PF5-3]
MSFKSGFIAIIGRPNSGKSTLLNTLMQTKLAITSDKPQTTRNNILGILNNEAYQLVFVDTPGVHKPRTALGKNMNKGVYTSMQDADIIYLVVDGTKAFGSGDDFLLNRIQNTQTNVFLVLNKVDSLTKEELIMNLELWQSKFDFKEIIPISALKNDNVDELLETTLQYLEDGAQFYPVDMISDRKDDFRVKEIIREKVLFNTREEIPHGVAVIIEQYEEMDNHFDIQALIIVERKSQKGILIGKQGAMIKKIRLSAQRELKSLLHKKVNLELYVRIEEDWRNKENKLNELGYKEYDNE